MVMKQILIITVLILGMTVNAQKNIQFIPVLTYEDCNNPEEFVKLKKRGKAGEYKTMAGGLIKLRDTIILQEAFANLGQDALYYINILEGNPNDGGRIALQILGAMATGSDSTLGDANRMREKPGEPTTVETIRFVRPTKKRPAKVEILLRSIYGSTSLATHYYRTDVE